MKVKVLGHNSGPNEAEDLARREQLHAELRDWQVSLDETHRHLNAQIEAWKASLVSHYSSRWTDPTVHESGLRKTIACLANYAIGDGSRAHRSRSRWFVWY